MSDIKLVVIGDSLAMHDIDNNIPTNKTYPYLIKSNFSAVDLIVRNRRANTSLQQSRKQHIYDDIDAFNPDIFLFHLGIVDCSPRVIGRYEKFVLSVMPEFVTIPIKKFISKNRYFLTKVLKRVYVSESSFYKNIKLLLEHMINKNSNIIVIGINASSDLSMKSYNIKENIREYNLILEKLCKKLGCHFLENNYEKEYFLPDGIHLNLDGHKKLSDDLSRILRSMMN